MQNTIINGDALTALKTFADCHFDSCVTDPPYGYKFMGKKWDYEIPSVELWKEVLRVLKPGAHALIACGTRTQHRMTVNVEDAGFEIRDLIAWVYGSGFPKSLNISKVIDKKAGVAREVAGISCSPNSKPDGYTGERYKEKRKTKFGIVQDQPNKTSPSTFEAHQWEGWGTALKPAMELWALCRKPISEKNIAENVLKWGTGGINIDGCRIEGIEPHHNYGRTSGENSFVGAGPESITPPQGRFPSNFIHDGSDEVLNLFPQSAGQQGDVKGTEPSCTGDSNTNYFGKYNRVGFRDKRNDEGSAARFFYCAKASRSERNAGLEMMTKKIIRWSSGDKNPGSFQSEGTDKTSQNYHPTVKPIALMAYLCRLITPPKGMIIDPFGGSGSTGIAARNEGFSFVLIENEKDYVNISKNRVSDLFCQLEMKE